MAIPEKRELELLEIAEQLGRLAVPLRALDKDGAAATIQAVAEELAWDVKMARRHRAEAADVEG